MRKEDKRAYRTITKQNETVRNLHNQIKSLSRSIQRLKRQHIGSNVGSIITNTDSPAIKAQTLVNSGNVDQIRKELTFGFSLGNGVEVKLQESARRHKEKKAIHKVVIGPILEKYRLINKAKKDLSLSRKQLRCAKLTGRSCSLLQCNHKKKNGLGKTSSLVEEFFLEDANSSPTAGKRERRSHIIKTNNRRDTCVTQC